LWDRNPTPGQLHPWISQKEVDYVVAEFESSGWNGGLNWYRVIDLSWQCTPQLVLAKIKQPSLFLAGLGDMTLPMFGGVDGIKKTLADCCEQMEEPIFVDGAGHWIAEEKPADVNDAVLAFATKHVALFSSAALPEGVPEQPVDY
jgi:pimeloyl-ACP methyl ester carboxylesterase